MDNPTINTPVAGDSTKPEWYWVATGVLMVLLVATQSREISRPFYGLHSWAKAHGAWFGRTTAKFGFGYTKGFSTWVVGDPPPATPRRYLDHPQLRMAGYGLEAKILGWTEWAYRTWNILRSVVLLLVLLAIFRAISTDRTSILAGLIFVMLPITGFFSAVDWGHVLNWVAIWAYLVAAGMLPSRTPRARHLWLLAGAEFFCLQFDWRGAFFCFAIGVHYVARCLFRRQRPKGVLLCIMVVAPVLSLLVNFTIMAAGWGWDFGKIYDLIAWRSAGTPEVPFTWGDWFFRFWEYAGTNFTWPVLVLSGVYLLTGPARMLLKRLKRTPEWLGPYLPAIGLIALPGVFQILILKNSLRAHQHWEDSLAPFIALACALMICMLWDAVRTKGLFPARAVCGLVLGVVTVSCAMGLNHYHYIRWQHPQMIRLLKNLNKSIPSDKGLLSFESFEIFEHPVKGAHYRPEIAYYLDRPIAQAQQLNDILAKARTGKYTHYLVPQVWPPDPRVTQYLGALTRELRKHYPASGIAGAPGEFEEDGQMLRQGMLPYTLFDLRSSPRP